MVEGARLESVCTGNRTAGSNPALSANTQKFATMLSATKVFVESARSFALYLSNQTVRNSMRSLVHPWSDRSSAFGVHGSTAG